MKTIVTFIASVQALLVDAGYDYDKVLNACQSAMNDPETVKVTEGEAKRGAVKGGQQYKADGTLAVKDMAWRETMNLDYTAKFTAPIEMVKWHDSLAGHFKKTGNPTGKLSVGILPVYLRDWLDGKFKAGEKPAKNSGGSVRKNGNIESHKTAAPAGK